MSGGSYDYLFMAYNLKEMVDKRHHLLRMRTTLGSLKEEEFPGAAKAAEETETLLGILFDADKAVGEASMSLRDIWKAVEWWESNDGGPNDVVKALAELVPKTEKVYIEYLWCVGWDGVKYPLCVYMHDDGTTTINQKGKPELRLTEAEMAEWKPNWIFFWAPANADGEPTVTGVETR